ncbi:MAG: sigma-54 dependent transcriptional regulator [Cyanobacteria bacterium]|nr:sigma-54 dependent transcriptional regulator [Cyanobacteriota bacterium]
MLVDGSISDDRLKKVAEPSHSAERVLIVEDDPATRSGLTELVRTWGFTADEAADGAEALEKVTAFRPSIVVTDLVMPNMSGIELLKALQPEIENIKVILLTAQGTVDTAVEAVKAGAEDYLTKPLDPNKLQRLLERLAEINRQKRENQALRRQLNDRGRFGRIIGHSPAMRLLYQVLEQAAPTPASMLILGESGTGKELVAQTIHQLSPRAHAPFVAINCAAIPDTLLESEIFGHEKGAFTGATDRRAGCFELADRGTLFLDEIAEMTPATQVKLLRVLQERKFRRLGGRTEQEVDVRVLAATNIDPVTAIREGKLREDLYYRLNVFSISLPPLRERRDDLPLLIQAFIEEFNSRDNRNVKSVSPPAMRQLEQYEWPGNVRELRNVIERATILARGNQIEPAHLPVFGHGSFAAAPAPAAASAAAPANGVTIAPGMTVDEAEQKLIMATLDSAGGNKTRAAEMLGISLKTLHNKLNRFKTEASES